MESIKQNHNPTVLLRRLHLWRMAFLGMVILLAGLFIGAGVTLLTVRHRLIGRPGRPDQAGRRIMRDMAERLDLEKEQADAVAGLLKKHMDALRTIRSEARDRIGQQLKMMDNEISQLLNDRQRQLWSEHFGLLERRMLYGRRKPGHRSHRRPGEDIPPPPPMHPDHPFENDMPPK